MLTSIQLREVDNTTLISLPVGAPSLSTGVFIKDVEGLGPVKADITVSDFASYDGGLYQNSRTGTRNIVITLGFSPRFDFQNDVSTTRDNIYSLFPPKAPALLVFVFDDFAGGNSATRRIEGYVESVEPVMFSEKPEVQISILCPRPYFASYSSYSIEGRTGQALDVSTFGTAPAGFVFDMTLIANSSIVTLETEFDEPIVYEDSLKIGDRLRISTMSGNKYALKTLAGSTSSASVLDNITSGSMAMSLDRRTKSFIVNKNSNTGTPYVIRYTPEYVGI